MVPVFSFSRTFRKFLFAGLICPSVCHILRTYEHITENGCNYWGVQRNREVLRGPDEPLGLASVRHRSQITDSDQLPRDFGANVHPVLMDLQNEGSIVAIGFQFRREFAGLQILIAPRDYIRAVQAIVVPLAQPKRSSAPDFSGENLGGQKPCSTKSSMLSALCCDSRCIIFSTYFAIRSASRFTGSPGCSECKLVFSTVCGMMAMVQRLWSSLATVKLMPSIEIEP
jgi:hypothetical protein